MASTRIFSKTDLGLAAIKNRDRSLSVKQRMLLITIDGQKTLSVLSQACNSLEEAQALCEELMASGFIQATGLPPVAAAAQAALIDNTHGDANPTPAAAAVSPAEVAKMVRRACRALEDLLGPNGMHLVMKLEECKTLAQLETVVLKLKPVVANMQSEKKAEDFVNAALGR